MSGLMEGVIDYIVNDLVDFCENSLEGVIEGDVVVFWGDPGIIAVQNYPCFTVAPVDGSPNGGTTAAEFRDLTVVITFLIDAREFWEVDKPEEATADRTRVKVSDLLESRYAEKAKSLLDHMNGVRSVSISGTRYTPQPRGPVFALTAEMTMTVNRSRPRPA